MPKLAQYPTWDDNTARDEDAILDLDKTWDENNSAEEFFNYLFDTISEVKYFEGIGTLELPTINLAKGGRIQSSKIEWEADTPAGTTVAAKTALSRDKGITWGPWLVTNNGAIPGLTAGLDVTNYRLKVRFELSTADTNISPEITKLTITINSRKIMRLMQGGALKVAKAITDNATETL